MPTCTKCKNNWTWKQTFTAMMTMNYTYHCPICGSKQFQSKSSKTKSSLLNLFIFLPLLIQPFTTINGMVLLISIPIIAIIIFITLPFFMKLSGEDELLF